MAWSHLICDLRTRCLEVEKEGCQGALGRVLVMRCSLSLLSLGLLTLNLLTLDDWGRRETARVEEAPIFDTERIGEGNVSSGARGSSDQVLGVSEIGTREVRDCGLKSPKTCDDLENSARNRAIRGCVGRRGL